MERKLIYIEYILINIYIEIIVNVSVLNLGLTNPMAISKNLLLGNAVTMCLFTKGVDTS